MYLPVQTSFQPHAKPSQTLHHPPPAQVLTPAALTFFVSYADGAVESLWSIDQYFDFVLVLMLSTGLSFQVRRVSVAAESSFIIYSFTSDLYYSNIISITPRLFQSLSPSFQTLILRLAPATRSRPLSTPLQVPVIQVMLGQLGLVSSAAMFSQWKFVVVGATVAAAVLTPSTDPFTQTLLAVPLVGLYMGGAGAVRLIERRRDQAAGGGAGA